MLLALARTNGGRVSHSTKGQQLQPKRTSHPKREGVLGEEIPLERFGLPKLRGRD
jgi:hypothetical protein